MKKRRKRNIVDQLRQAIADSGESQYAIGKATGVDPGVICRFVAKERDVTLATAAKLAEHLKLELRPRR